MRRMITALCLGTLVMGGCSAGGVAGPRPAGTARDGGAAKAPKKASTVLAVAASSDTPTVSSEVAARTTWIGAAPSSGALMADSNEQVVGVWVDVPKVDDRAHVPTAVTLSIDTSGSMEGTKIREARAAARKLVEQMSDGDIVSVQTFSDGVMERVPPTVLDANSRGRIIAVIEELPASGGTNLFDGLRSAELTSMGTPASHPVRRVVVISDGKATVGPSSPVLLGNLAEAGVSRGVQVTSLGVGLDYDEAALNNLAQRSSGRLFHLADPEEMPSIIAHEVALLQGTMATRAVVRLVPAPGVQILGVKGVRSIGVADGSVEVPLGTLYGGQSRELLIKVSVRERDSQPRGVISARLEFVDPADGGLSRVQEVVATASFTHDRALSEQEVTPRVQALMATLDASELAESAAANANAGRLEEAAAELAQAERRLADQAQRAQSEPERRRLTATAERMGHAKKNAEAAAAAPPSAKPAAARGSALDANAAFMGASGY